MVTTITRLGTWDDVFVDVEQGLSDIAEHLRSLVVGLHGDAVEVPRKGDRAVSFGFGEKKMSESYCYLMPHKSHLNVGFWWGTALEDPNGLLEGTGKKLRHVKVRDMAMARSAKLAQLIHSAIVERQAGLEERAAEMAEKKRKPAARKTKSAATKKTDGPHAAAGGEA